MDSDNAMLETASSPTKRRTRVYSKSSLSPTNVNSDDDYDLSPRRRRWLETGDKVLLGLSIAGFGWSLLTSIFGMFHVDLFLRAYSIPLQVYSRGNIVITVINTVANLLGAWFVDHLSTSMSRSDLTGVSGCLFSLCFLTPFFRWWQESSRWDGLHYIISMALYHTMFSFTAILMASVVNDNHEITWNTRVNYMASGKFCNFIGSFVATRIGLALFDPSTLFRFRVYLLVLASIAALLFLIAQALISSDPPIMVVTAATTTTTTNTATSTSFAGHQNNHHHNFNHHSHSRDQRRFGYWSRLVWPRQYHHLHADSDLNLLQRQQQQQAPEDNSTSSDNFLPHQAQLQWRQVVRDFWKHGNFKAWIGMEMLLEAQTTFVSFFLKTFVDGLLLDTVLERQSCDWLLSIIRPLTDILSILAYIPIRRFGYTRVYLQLFYWNIFLSALMLYFSRTESTAGSSYWMLFFICVYPTLTGAVQSAGFHLAQADMVLEMKRNHALEGRHDEPSMAGLFMGANALFCKPAESILPVTAANVLEGASNNGAGGSSTRESLFYLLVLPPLICSCFQILAWRYYDLTPIRTSRLRDELKRLRSSSTRSLLEAKTTVKLDTT